LQIKKTSVFLTAGGGVVANVNKRQQRKLILIVFGTISGEKKRNFVKSVGFLDAFLARSVQHQCTT
jgi:hypothetical protein